jgi:hypothetical protein
MQENSGKGNTLKNCTETSQPLSLHDRGQEGNHRDADSAVF